MAHPIKFKLVRRDTGQTFHQWAKALGKKLMPFLDGNGQPGYLDLSDFYLSWNFLKTAEWRLSVAARKEAGRWVYQEVV